MREFKIVPIRNGTVLDHLRPGSATEILAALGYPIKGSSKVVSLSMNLPGSAGLKDVMKFEDVELSPDELAKVKRVSAHGTVVTIRNYDVAAKVRW